MKVLVVGGGGREHAIIKKLKENSKIKKIYCAPGNGGIANDAECISVSATDIEGLVNLSKDKEIDFVCVTPDDPLALGAVDALEEAGFPCFGPRKNAAIIEASKVFAKDLMQKYDIPTARYATFTDVNEALAYVEESSIPIVIKADGLALGKGVVIAESKEDAKSAIKDMMVDSKFGNAGKEIVIEEYLEGPEVSVLCFTDGKCIKPMVSSMDHKRAFDNDEGLNTGGMGTIAPNPFYTKDIQEEALETILLPTIRALEKEDRVFKGCLYVSLMLTKDGPKVIEYNARFGDPETQVVLPLLESDLLTIMEACRNGNLEDTEVKFSDKSACCVVYATKGYPEHYEKGFPLSLSDEALEHCYFAGVKEQDGEYFSSGGRVLGITSVKDTLEEAIQDSYRLINEVDFKDGFYRKDIGAKAIRKE